MQLKIGIDVHKNIRYSRAKAKELRLKAESRNELKYLGNPCKYGHYGWRYVKNDACVKCQTVTRSKPPLPNPALVTKLKRAYDEVKARYEAARKGKIRYHSTPCKRCGGTEWYVRSKECVLCKKLAV